MKKSLVAVGPVVMLHDRPVIPIALRKTVLDHLHAGHQGANSMFERASSTLYWPNFRADIVNHKAECHSCSRYQPSNPSMPPVIPEDPIYPFQSICADFYTANGSTFLTIVDRYSNWLSVFQLQQDTSEELLRVLRDYFATFGIPITFTSDGAKVFVSKTVEEFFQRYGVIHRITTAYNPRSNKRAEVAVKSAKRLIRNNLTQTGSLNSDKMTRALLQHRNTPCPLTGLSPSQIIFGRILRDFLPLQPGKFVPRKEWRIAADTRAAAYSKRIMDKSRALAQNSRQLSQLEPGQHVMVQDQNKASKTHKQWNRTGVVVSVGEYNDYYVRLHGSRLLTKRNRQFLKPITPYEESQPSSPPTDTVPKPFPQPANAPEDNTGISPPESEMDHPPPIPKIKLRRDNEGLWVKESQDNTE